MKISLEWISDYVELIEKNPKRIAEMLTEKSSEVERIILPTDVYATCVSGKLLEFTKLEKSKKELFAGKFDLGSHGIKGIVFGKGKDFELAKGGMYPVALPGTELPTGVRVENAVVHGAKSEGMALTEAELGTSFTKSGLITFPEGTPLGEPIMEIIGKAIENVVIGEVVELSKHPNADKLSLTKVDVGGETPLEIVCGGSNLKLHAKVPVALVGANLWGKIAIKAAEIRGIASHGMICSTEELGIGPSENKEIYLLPDDAPIGQEFFSYVFGGNAVLEVENTTITNRPDLFSHVGFSREFNACGISNPKEGKYPSVETTCREPLPMEITIRKPEEICPRYMAVHIIGVDGKRKSPEWMAKRLESCGIRPLGALIDITNYAMLDRGIPLHAFDADLVGKDWTMRTARKGEKMTTLDEIERELPEGTIILEDERNGIFDLCGIMGGLNSGIREETKSIILHAPIYDPIKIRRSSLALAHRTEASVIYEKGIPPKTAEEGFYRAIELLLEVFPEAKIASKILDLRHYDEKQRMIEFDPALVRRIAGMDISKGEMKHILEDLGFFLVEMKEGNFDVNVPAWRNKDISIPEDIAEEIVRIYGLNRIAEIAPEVKPYMFSPAPQRKLEKEIARILVKNGFYEIVTLAFSGESLLKRCGFTDLKSYVHVANPISEDLAIMRPSLSPRLLETAEKNRRFTKTFRLFECGNVFRLEENRKVEEFRITSLLAGDGLIEAKAIADEIIEEKGWHARLEEWKPNVAFAHPGRSAVYRVGKAGEIKIFEVHPKTIKEFDLPSPSTIICMTIPPLAEVPVKAKKILALPKFQEIPFDFSILCPRKQKIAEITKDLEKLDERIASFSVMEVWEGKGVPEGQKSVTLSFEFRAPDRTLTDAERDELFHLILKEMEKRGAKFRFEK